MTTMTLGDTLRWIALGVDDDTATKLKAQALRADVTEQRARNAVAQVLHMDARLTAVRDAHAEHRRTLTHDGARPERVDTCHCLGCVLYRAAEGTPEGS